MTTGIVYTETAVHAAPEQFVADAPYQLAIVTLDEGGRVTVRIAGDRVAIGDKVEFAEDRGGVLFFTKGVCRMFDHSLYIPGPALPSAMQRAQDIPT